MLLLLTRYERMDIAELEKRLRAIDEEETSKIQKVEESYRQSKDVIKRLMDAQDVGGTTVNKQCVTEEDDDIDKSEFLDIL